MKKIYSTILPIVMILCLAMLSSCSGNSDETENGGTDDGILRITADKTAIQADGVEKVTFTVKLGTKDVSEESTMNLILVKESGEENLDYGVRAFSTSVPGTYVFKARYYEGKAMVSENEVTVQVAPVSGGTSYYHKLLGMQFTSIGCQACPALSTTLKAIQTLCGEKDERFGTWFDALDYMYKEAMKIDFDIAIIGCGAYGMPLAAMLKKAGKQAIHLGGATQLLFGIKGRRWEENYPSKIATFFNEYWVYPAESEKPKNASTVEMGCYWK